MSVCCISGCKSRRSSSSDLKFYRIPTGLRLFQANRRRLWLEAIEAVNGSTEKLRGNARICGAHFLSGEASMDIENPDFVPTVFSQKARKLSASSKRLMIWNSRRRRKRRRKANEEKEVETSPPRGDSPVDLQCSVSMEETQKPSSQSVSEEEAASDTRATTETAEDESNTTNLQIVSSPNQTSTFLKVPEGLPELHQMNPTVLLKPVFVTEDGYQCEICSQNFPLASQLVKHEQQHGKDRQFICELCGKLFSDQADFTAHQHVDEPCFPCNMCDRTFTTAHNLKRHKLLHVKDGRKCRQCGVLFCRRHKHILFQPQTEQASSTTESQHSDSDSLSDNCQKEEPVATQISDLDDKTQSTMPAPPSPGQLPKTENSLPPASDTEVLTEIPASVEIPILVEIPFSAFQKPSPVSVKHESVCVYPQKKHSADFIQPHLPQHPELSSSLKIFSPQFLTSAFLQVERNYEYIFSKSRGVKKEEVFVKEEQSHHPLIPPVEQNIVKDERTAYDLEMLL